MKSYVKKRMEYKKASQTDDNYLYTTPRTLLGIIRLAQAMARLRFSEIVREEDVDEALRLMEISQISVEKAHGPDKKRKLDKKSDHKSAIFGLITQICKDHPQLLVMRETIEKKILNRGYVIDELEECLQEYE